MRKDVSTNSARNTSVEQKVEGLIARLGDVEEELGKPDVFDDQKHYRELTQEHSYLKNLKEAWEELKSSRQQLKDNEEMLGD